MELRQVERENHSSRGPGVPSQAVPALGFRSWFQSGALDDRESGLAREHAEYSLDRVRGREIDLPLFGLEVRRAEVQRPEPLQHEAPRPVHRSRREPQARWLKVQLEATEKVG